MKNLKAVIIYGVIIVLCLAAFAGYIISNHRSGGGNESAAAAGSVETTAATSAAAEETTAVVTQETTEVTSATSALSANAQERLKKSGAAPETDPVVGVGRGDDFQAVTRKAIDDAGGLDGIIQKGDTVLIKPNLCTYGEPGSPMITDYRMVQEIVSLCREKGAGKIIIAEGPITGLAFDSLHASTNGYTGTNFKDVEFVELNDLDKEDCYEIKAEKSVTGKAFFIPKVYMDADVVISAPKLKTHFQPDSYVSLCLKNMYGVPPGKIYGLGYKIGLHNLGLKESLVDLSKICRADFYVIDGVVGGEGYGPLNNQPVDSKIIFAGKDPVAVDTAALTFMGFTVDEIPTVTLAAQENLGIADLAKIKVVGEDIEKAKMKFTRP